ncbi:IS4 family transposase [Paraliobacillus zengyii]|uniref:IS4 family transposase n=3 Tax=Paraliobacillus TaxID=200903 RepID=UPI0013A6E8F2|nr:IS4 family transposase [Paraliobacillus zengyii]
MYFKKEMEPFIQGIHQVLSVSEVRQWAREIGFVQRQNKLKPEDFLSICAFLKETVGSSGLGNLCSSITRISGADISKQALHQRFDAKGVAFLQGIFNQLAEQQAIFMRPLYIDHLFSRIRILDATSFGVPKNDPDHPDGAKIQLEYELFEGKFLHTFLYDQTKSDQHAARELADTIEPGDLILRDLGYFSGEHLKKIDRAGGFYISRVPANMTFWTWDKKGKMMQIKPEEDAKKLEHGEAIDYGHIQIGKKGKNTLQTRLVVQQLTEEQKKKREGYLQKRRRKGGHTQSATKKNQIQILATNITSDQVEMQELYPIYSLRWQVEILFKTWKSLFHIDKVRAMNPERFACHLYGTLIHILLSSMIAFQCRYYLYQKHQIESSEFKSIDHVKSAIEEDQGQALYHSDSFITLIKNIYQNVYRHGRKDHRYQHKSPFDILYLAYERTVKAT